MEKMLYTEQKITDTLESNYMPYAMSVIISRAIPEIDGFQNEEDGSLGMDFINLFHRVTINLESMYLNVEKDN